METIIEAVSRAIDNHCGRRFFSASETRYYTAESPWRLDIDDVSDVAATASFAIYTDDDGDGTFENTWAATDFDAQPYNAALNGLPYTSIERTVLGNYSFPLVRKGVKITGPFGFAAVPKPINRACVFLSARLFKLYIVPLGQSAATAVGTISLKAAEIPMDIQMLLLRPYERLT